jgi:molybdopterin converting factor small subunit
MIAPRPRMEAPLQVRVRLSGELARAAGGARAELEVPEGATVADLLVRLAARHPELEPALQRALPMVRGANAGRERALAAGEEVALLLPAAGGSGQAPGGARLGDHERGPAPAGR